MNELFFPVLMVAGGIFVLVIALLLGLLVLAYAMHLVSGQDPYDEDTFDYEDLYPDKSHKHHK
jgi:hypothetical protein